MIESEIERKNNFPSKERLEFFSEVTEELFNSYSQDGKIIPEIICDAANIGYSTGEYGDKFDGMLQFDGKAFHIFINSSVSNSLIRQRFTFCHELGHFIIDEHRNALAKGISLGHFSQTGFQSDILVEREADFFAAGLLMPRRRFTKEYQSFRGFSFENIKRLANSYQSSVLSVIFRLFQLDLHNFMIVKIEASQPTKIKAIFKSRDFYFYPKYKYDKIPEDSQLFAAIKTGKFCDRTQEIWTGDWFEVTNESKMYEHTLNYQNYYYSILWKK